MSTYRRKTNYRKIYEQHYGTIPVDEFGRTYEIHHLDGDHNNNDISNLVAVTIQEHYGIHYDQDDYGACLIMSERMKISPEEKSRLASARNRQMILDGSHPWMTDAYRASQRKRAIELIANNDHVFQTRSDGTNLQTDRVAAGTHNFTDELRQRIVDEGKNLLYGNSDWHRENTLSQIAEGRHCSSIKKTCPHCGITVDSANYSRSHGNNCELFTGIKKKIAKHPPRKLKTCEVCGKTMDTGNFGRHGHGPSCSRTRE